MEILRTAIFDFCRRKKGKPFSPKEVLAQMYPNDWERFLPEILEEMTLMHKEGVINLTLESEPVSLDLILSGKEMISCPEKLK
jgi:hypothetical protein